MSKFIKFASVTKKITLAIIGIFLMLFLLVHGGINLCMLRADGGEWFRAAAHFMGTNYIVKVFEIVLFAAFVLHIVLALILQIQNWKARPVRYRYPNRSVTSPGSKFMIHTGILVILFLVLHMFNFYLVKTGLVEGKYMVEFKDVVKVDPVYLENPGVQEKIISLFASHDPVAGKTFNEIADNITKEDLQLAFGPGFTAYEPDFFNMAKELFNQPFSLIVYLVLIFMLGIHLRHAFPSAFHTLGLNSTSADKVMKGIGLIYAFVIVVMFWAVAIGMNLIY